MISRKIQVAENFWVSTLFPYQWADICRFSYFSVIQILREINFFGKLESRKVSIFGNFLDSVKIATIDFTKKFLIPPQNKTYF